MAGKKTTREQTEQFKKDSVLKALMSTGGTIYTACKKAKIGRTTFYRYMKNDPDFAEAVREAQESCLDLAEEHLWKRIKLNDTALFFYLNAKGSARGYGNKLTVKQAQSDLDDLSDEELKDEIVRLQKFIDGKQ